MEINHKLGLLRNKMAEYRLDGYVVNNSDPHFSEYLPERFRQIRWLSNFSGSNALVFVTNNEALLWTDGRYYIQAERELAGSDFKMVKMATKGHLTLVEAIKKLLPSGRTLGVDANIISQKSYEEIEKVCEENEIELVDKYDLISEIWSDRPELSKNETFIHNVEFTGLTAKEKVELLREEMSKIGADSTVISSLVDIAWLYNLRGSDINNNPVITSYSVIDMDHAMFFIDSDKLTLDALEHLHSNEIDYLGYDEVFATVNNFKNQSIVLDKNNTARSIFKLIDDSNKIIDKRDLTSDLKAKKNETEIENQKNAYIKDGVALTKFIYWLKNHKDISRETEFTVGKKLEEFRKEQENYIMDSFDTIAGYQENGAMMHYRAEEETAKKLKNEGFLLVDSGGQYLDGTTDTTRTIALGKLTDEEIKDFTLVLKGHIDLLDTIFLEGTTGHALDAITRRPIWKERMDYKSGTGHGVGYFLGVHEGPQNISRKEGGAPLEEGMVVTVEPGIYKEGKYGIRTENVALVIKDEDTPDGQFFKFEVMSFVPIDIDAIDVELLDEDQKQYLNNYHKDVYNNLKDYLTREESKWLKDVTKPID